MPTTVTSNIPPGLLSGQATRLSVYTYDSATNLVEVPWDQARTMVIDAVRPNGAVVTPSVGVIHSYGTDPIATQDGGFSSLDAIISYYYW